MEVGLYVLGGVLLGAVCVVTVLVARIKQKFSLLLNFLLGIEWKNMKQCLAVVPDESFVAAFLLTFYKSKQLEVRLSDHVFACQDCKTDALTILEDLVAEGSVPADVVTGVAKNETLLLQVFENHGFCFDSVIMFEYRITSRNRRRGWRKLWDLKFKLPQWISPQPAV